MFHLLFLWLMSIPIREHEPTASVSRASRGTHLETSHDRSASVHSSTDAALRTAAIQRCNQVNRERMTAWLSFDPFNLSTLMPACIA
jgi:hypothetical protein